jgi:hypothetical protein
MPPRTDSHPGLVTSPTDEQAVAIPAPSQEPLTYKGEALSSGLIMRLFRTGQDGTQNSRNAILEARAYRRREASSLIRVAPSWARTNPEAAAWVTSVLPERISLEADLTARVGAVEPEYVREPLGFTERDRDDAEACQAFLEEWRLRSVPTQTMFGKCVEDGQFGWAVLPSHLDYDGVPTFFETLSERAYEGLGDDEKKSYKPDETGRDKKRYVKLDAKGQKKVNPSYDKGDDKKSEQAHKEAVERHLLKVQPVNVRIIPALDCAPIFTRGKGRDRWHCEVLIERSLYSVEELLEEGHGWPGLGDRLLVPHAYNADGTTLPLRNDEIGKNALFYLYSAYMVCEDAQGHKRPVIAFCVGGTSTSYSQGRGTEPENNADVGMIDFYDALKYTEKGGKQCGLEGPLWGYHGGMHSEDDDPDWYWRPAMHHVLPLIRQIEGNETAMNATITVSAFTGHIQEIDAGLASSDLGEAAILDQSGDLRITKPPRPGAIEVSTGKITPFQQAQIGQDAWRKLAADRISLQTTTATDQPPPSGQSGHAQIVQMMSGQQVKRQIREGVRDAAVAMAEVFLRIVDAIHHKYDVGWPIQTTQERPVGESIVSARDIMAYDQRWVGEGNFNLDADYPEEENLARVDLEASLADRGYGNFDRVMKALGENDPKTEWKKVLRDMIRKSPAYRLRAEMKMAEQTGDVEMVAMLKDLQNQGQMTKAGVPGAPNGIPTAALNRQGQSMAGPGKASTAQSIRGGIQAAEMGGDTMAANAEAAMTQGAA